MGKARHAAHKDGKRAEQPQPFNGVQEIASAQFFSQCLDNADYPLYSQYSLLPLPTRRVRLYGVCDSYGSDPKCCAMVDRGASKPYLETGGFVRHTAGHCLFFLMPLRNGAKIINNRKAPNGKVVKAPALPVCAIAQGTHLPSKVGQLRSGRFGHGVDAYSP